MIRKRCLYAASICLCIWYSIILYFAVFPNVSEAYRLYYIDHVLYNWPGNDGLTIRSGEKIYFNSQANKNKVNYLGAGWSFSESWGTWTNGKTSDLYFVLSSFDKNNITFTMETTAFSPEGLKKVELFANDLYIGSLFISPDTSKEYQISIPKNIIKEKNLLHLKFNISNPTTPKEHGLSDDSRQLGLGVLWVKLIY